MYSYISIMQKKPPNIDALLEQVRALGYEVKRKAEFENHTFQVESDLLHEFFAIQQQRKIKVYEAINEAIAHWVMAHKTDSPKK